ncbi:Glycosyltransferase involved in cell wall bisynthesis [Halobaculum gomorrense]|uniref:Glycosyltransferase involved in cell wall bisynthesis n=2 Tax=Halobaculum gomorrense TaxID=43928 RepID=A0A1M5JBB2_9EURY|nr:Glycosyltransferase involved in cell wall bisynthesis [Halobaculum gomorrense]
MRNQKINISYLIGNLNKEHGGAQQLLFDICRHLPSSEFDTTIYYMFGEGTYTDEFERHDASVVNIGASSNYDLAAFVRLVRHLRTSDHDVLQTNSPISGVWGRIAGRLSGMSRVVSIEHSVHTSYPLSNRIANGITLPLSTAIVGVSDAVVNSLRPWERRLLTDETKIRTIQNGVDVKAIEQEFSKTDDVLSNLQISREQPVIGTVGRFTEAKGYKYLIRAFPEIKQHRPDAQLLLIGGGDLMTELKSEAKSTDYQDDIVFTGLLSNVFPYLPAFDVAVFPSLWEGLPLAPAEAMAARCPIIGTDIPPFREVVNDAGILVEPKDEAALADAIIQLLDDPVRRRELGSRGYKRVTENFSIERTVEEYVDLYRELVDE